MATSVPMAGRGKHKSLFQGRFISLKPQPLQSNCDFKHNISRSEIKADPASLWKFPTTKWSISKQKKISKHLEGWKVCFPCYVLDTHIDWMPRERKTEVTCAKIVHCSAGNQDCLTAKACEAISTKVHAVQLGAPLGLPSCLCQYRLFWNIRYLSTDKNVMYNQWLKSKAFKINNDFKICLSKYRDPSSLLT